MSLTSRPFASRACAPAARRGALAAGALSLALLAGCATPPAPLPAGLLLDERFGAPNQPVDSDEALAVSDEMRRFVGRELYSLPRFRPGPQELFDALTQRERLRVEYDSTFTRNAAQAFTAQRGNCLSLALMTAAIAHELKLKVTYQQVETDETWTRTDNIAFLDAHVNITLGRRLTDTQSAFDRTSELTIDFLPPQDISRLRSRPIPEEEVVAMFMNNRAAEALVRGEIDNAYWWARGAALKSPYFAPGLNTLGVIYLRHGDIDAAGRVLQTLIDRDPDDKQAVSNLAIVLDRQGHAAEARGLRDRLARIEPHPPFQYYFVGQEAMRRGDYMDAKAAFTREVDRAQYNSEFHFWLGIANLRLGDLIEARRQINIALAVSTDDADRGIYAAKLERLRTKVAPTSAPSSAP